MGTKAKERRKTSRHPEPNVAEEQCLYCSLYFQNVSAHQRLVHKGEIPDDKPPAVSEKSVPGTIVHPLTVAGQPPAPPYKVPWTRKWVEEGYECRQCPPGISRYLGPVAVCERCHGGPVTPMFPKVEYEPPRDMTVTFNGVPYRLQGGEVNIVPSIIRDIARESVQGDRMFTKEGYIIPKQASDGVLAGTKKLEMVGFMPAVEEDKSF